MASGESPGPANRSKGRKNDFPEPFQSKIGIRQVEHSKLDQFESLVRGATCTVYRAKFEGREVAMKSYPGADQRTFKHEISLFSGLDHPNVPEFYCYAINKRRCSIAMEKMDGDLQQLMHDRMTKAETDNCPPFKIVEAVDIIHQIAEGVNYLHKIKIVHRDLKSTNILYKMVEGESTSGTRFMNVKVADFGLSATKEKSKTYSNLTPNLGISRWMPPELIQPTKMDGKVNTADSGSVLKLPFKCDVYSFAMVCFEIMTGDVPFSNTKTEGVLEMVLNGERPSFPNYCPCHLPDHCHPKLKALIEECWNQEPSERPSFSVICQKLKDLKGLLLAGLTSSQRPLPAINDASSSAGTNVDPSHVSKHDLLEPKHMESMYDMSWVQGRLRFCKLGHDPRDWLTQVDEVDALNRFRDEEHPVFTIRRILFDALLYEDQLLYMDAVLYYPERPIGMKPWNNIFEWLGMVHGSSADNIRLRLMGLKRKALLEDLGDGSTSIGVHGLWREFCASESNTGQLEYRRWVYMDQEISEERALLLHGGWEELRRICLKGSNFRINSVKRISLMYCTKVGVLKLVNCRVEDEVLDLSALKHLRSLEIHSCLISLSKDSPVEIFGLGMLMSLVVLKWDNIPRQSPCIEEIGCLTELQVLDLVSGENENKLPNVGKLLFLREAKFCYSDGADTIEGLSSRMTNLRYLDLGGCHHLRTCPGVGDLDALEELDLSGCSMLRELPNLRKLTNLVKLVITGCHSIRGLVGLGDLVSLQELRAGSCWGLTEFPDMIMLTNLQVLDILYVALIQVRGLGNLLALQELRIDALRLEGRPDLYRFTRLKTLHVNGWGPQGLPSVTYLGNLKWLTILDCSGVDELAGLLDLTGLEALCFRNCEFKDVSGLCNLTALQRLEVHYCSKLESFPDVHMLTRLELLEVSSCRSLRHWEGVSTPSRFSGAASNVGTPLQLETLRIRDSPITQMPDLSDFPRLKELDIVHCGDLTSLISTGPLTALEVLQLYGCTSLRALPDLSCAVGLRSFTLSNCGVQLDAEEIKELKAMASALVLHPQDVELEEPQ